jgi:ABC-type uncharacterized transport system ATPase subunit
LPGTGAGVAAVRPAAVSTINAPVVALDGIGKRYGRMLAVDDVSLKVDRGQLYGLIGADGAGKSSLMKSLNITYLHCLICAAMFGLKPFVTCSRQCPLSTK